MIQIEKQGEPSIFSETKRQHISYDELHGDEKNKLKEVLIQEQGGLCAYCMAGIKLGNSTIEHYIPRKGKNGNPALSLEYRNMFAVCNNGRKNRKENAHCDVSKDESLLHIDPRRKQDIAQIKYKKDGYVYSENPEFDKDLNEVLNLNLETLRRNRKEARDTFLKELNKKKNGEWNKEYLRKAFDRYSRTMIPYVGIIRYIMKERLERA